MTRSPESMADLVKLRQITKLLSEQLRTQLQQHLQTLTPLFRPKRILGDCISGPATESPPGAEKAFTDLRRRFSTIAERCGMARELQRPLPSIRVELALHPWEYPLTIQAANGPVQVRITSPTQWVLTYTGTYDVPEILRAPAVRGDGAIPAVGEFAVNALVLGLLFERFPGLHALFAALRFPVEVVPLAALGDLGVVRISSPFASLRPKDDLVLQAVQLSGFATFEEVVDLDAVDALSDPLRTQIEQSLREAGTA